ncbi:MAG: type I restriction-modification system subunit M N-terminal domain-containing protein [Burkholderiales bacterium]
MNNATQQIVNKAWNFAHALRDDGLSYMGYTEQITFLLFLEMADEQTRAPYGRPPIVPPELGWTSLLAKDGDDLEVHFRHVLEELGRRPGMLGEIFKKARPDIQNPATLKRLIVDLIEPEKWLSMDADVKGDIYEGLLAKSAAESPKGAGQHFTPRELIDEMRPGPDDKLARRDKLNLDIFWLKDRSLEESENLPDPDVIAQQIADDLQTALDQIDAVPEGLKR